MKNITTQSSANGLLSSGFAARRAHAASRRGLARLAVLGGFAIAALGALPAQATPADTMIKAVKFDDVKEVNKQLSQGMDPNMVDNQGMPLLVIAAREKSDQVVGALIANPKTNIEIVDRVGENAMMMAALNNDVAIVKLLIEKGAEVNKKGWAPLHYAAANGNDDVVQILIDHSAYVDAGSPNDTTPLMMAARGNHISTIKLLLDNGADLNVKNQIGMNALDFAKQYHAPDAIAGLSARMQQTQKQMPASAPAAQ